MAICTKCWQHINDFYTYQQTVLEAQTKLEQDIKQMVPLIKLEEEFLIDVEPKSTANGKASEIFNDVFNSIDMEEKSEMFLPDLELSDIKDDNPFSTDDEKPLLEHLPKTTRKKRGPYKTKKLKTKETLTKKRGRKTKCKDDQKTSSDKNKTALEEKRNDIDKTQDTLNKKETARDNDAQNKETNDQDSQQESSNDEGDEDYDSDVNQVDPDGFVSSNDRKKVSRQKTEEIDAFIAEWKQELECVLCNSTFGNFPLLRKHFREEHPNKKCFVTCCQRKLHHRFHIVEHIRYHIDPDTFKCKICGRVNSNSRTLTKHMKDKHTAEGLQRRFECNMCPKRFTKKCSLKMHLETHETGRDYQCSECGKGYATEQRRRIHERMVHNVDRVCDQCGKTIHGIYALKQHLLEHAGIQKRKWPCDQCNAELNSHSSLKRHRTVAHHDGSTVYVCSECGKIAPTETALRSHKKFVHQAVRKHKCTICDKSFKVALVLREHMATHTGEDLYSCPHCPKTFKVNANMHHHRKKAHPKEWAEARMNKPIVTKVDVNLVSNEVVI